MSERRVSISSPPHVDHAKLRDARYSILAETPSGQAIVFYDPATATGAVYMLEAAIWCVYGPLAFGAWASTLQSRGIIVREGVDLQAWLDATASEIAHGALN